MCVYEFTISISELDCENHQLPAGGRLLLLILSISVSRKYIKSCRRLAVRLGSRTMLACATFSRNEGGSGRAGNRTRVHSFPVAVYFDCELQLG